MHEIVIIGGGPAGLSAAIYAARRGLKAIVISQDIGGQITKTNEIENYPGVGIITGADLAKKLYDQARQFGAEFLFDEVKSIKKVGDNFKIKTIGKEIESKSIILCIGKKPRELGVPGEEKLKGHGVSYCATCDAPFFRDKIVAVVGDGNSAIYSAIASAKVAKHVFILSKREDLHAEQALIEKIEEQKNIEVISNVQVKEIKGEKRVETVELNNGREITTDGIIIEIGYVIDRTLVDGLVEIDEKGQILADDSQRTSVPGLFAAGDVTNSPYKQIVVAASEGSKAALSCFGYLQKLKK